MSNEIYKAGCKGCDASQGNLECPGSIIELDGKWMLNHYGGEEGFLGWLALQPEYHRMEFTELDVTETMALGRNIQKIEIALRHYWSINFQDDPIERLYVVYYFVFSTDPPLHDAIYIFIL